jgi:hypothetical protein
VPPGENSGVASTCHTIGATYPSYFNVYLQGGASWRYLWIAIGW